MRKVFKKEVIITIMTTIINKYKPIYFKDFETNDETIDILNTLIHMNNLNVLFIGDCGSGKTTFINSVIKEYYSKNTNTNVKSDKNDTCRNLENNILHINSLKDQGIHFYRNDVKTFCQTSSYICGKKKTIVLDDIDIINEQSQQVFRNYIDKYSNNVNFIASCSNSQKVIESLQSRFIIIKINPLTNKQLETIMNKIINAESIQFTPEAHTFMLHMANNNVKILINNIEKCKLLHTNQLITLDVVNDICSNISFSIFDEYTDYILNKQLDKAIHLIYDIHDKGYSVMDILDNYFTYIKITNILTEDQKYIIIPIICKYIVYFHNIHEDEIELALFTNNMMLSIN